MLNLVHVLVVHNFLTSEHDCILHLYQFKQSCHYDAPRMNKLHNIRQHTITIITTAFFDHHNYDCFFKKEIDKYVLPSMSTMKCHQLTGRFQ